MGWEAWFRYEIIDELVYTDWLGASIGPPYEFGNFFWNGSGWEFPGSYFSHDFSLWPTLVWNYDNLQFPRNYTRARISLELPQSLPRLRIQIIVDQQIPEEPFFEYVLIFDQDITGPLDAGPYTVEAAILDIWQTHPGALIYGPGHPVHIRFRNTTDDPEPQAQNPFIVTNIEFYRPAPFVAFWDGADTRPLLERPRALL